MTHRYRICGKVNSAFILNGLFYSVGQQIDNCFTEKEVKFIKEHCNEVIVKDLLQKTVPIVNTPKKKADKRVVSKDDNRESNGTSEENNT